MSTRPGVTSQSDPNEGVMGVALSLLAEVQGNLGNACQDLGVERPQNSLPKE